jgi:hypothetical protein
VPEPQFVRFDAVEPFERAPGYVLPGGVEHSAHAGPEGATVVDVFQPVREDYRARYST